MRARIDNLESNFSGIENQENEGAEKLSRGRKWSTVPTWIQSGLISKITRISNRVLSTIIAIEGATYSFFKQALVLLVWSPCCLIAKRIFPYNDPKGKIFEDLKSDVEKGKIALSDKNVHERTYKYLEGLTEEEKETFLKEIRKQVNLFYLNRVIKNKGAFLATDDEINTLEALGHSLEVFKEKDRVHTKITKHVLNIQNDPEFQNMAIQDIQERVKKEALFCRLKILKLNEEKIEQFNFGIDVWKKFQEHASNLLKAKLEEFENEELKEISHAKKHVKSLKELLKTELELVKKNFLKGFFLELVIERLVIERINRKNKLDAKSLSCTFAYPEEPIEETLKHFFREYLKEHLDSYSKCNVRSILPYFKKWHKHFSYNMGVEAEDPDDLQEGVCLGYASRVGALDQHNPDAGDDTHLNAGYILQKDRILQSVQMFAMSVARKKFLLKPSAKELSKNIIARLIYLIEEVINSLIRDSQYMTRAINLMKNITLQTIARQTGFKTYEQLGEGISLKAEVPGLNATQRAEKFCLLLEKKVKKLSKEGHLDNSEGIIHLTFKLKPSSHATYIRYDTKRGIYRYVDVNLGVFTLRAGNDLSSNEEMQRKFFTFLAETILCRYNDLETIKLHQLKDPLPSAERPATK